MPETTNQKFQQLTKTLLIGAASAVGLIALGLFGIIYVANQNGIANSTPLLESDFITAQLTDGNNNQSTFSLEVADSAEEWSKGLMGRTKLAENTGMIFIFPDNQYRSFWMRDTLIFLDMIFVDQDMSVVTIHKSAKPNQTSETYSSSLPAKYVIELAGGSVEKLDLEVGDRLSLINR